MNVVIVVATSGWGGVHMHSAGLAEVLLAGGHQVTMVELGKGVFRRNLPQRRFDLLELEIEADPRRIGVSRWLQLMGSLRGDVCVLAKGGLESGGWALDWAARRRFRRLVTVEHLCPQPDAHCGVRRHFGGLVPGIGLWRVRRRLRGLARSLTPDRIICVSDAVRRELTLQFRFPRSKTVTVQNGIDTERFWPSEPLRAAARISWKVSGAALVFGAIGRLHQVKGYDVAIQAFAGLVGEFPNEDLRLVLVGEGPEQAALVALAAQLGVSGRVLFPGPTDRARELLPGIDVFVMPSRNEGLPLALLEAMSCGCAPIVTDVGGNPEVVSRPEVGWVTPMDRPAEFQRAMREALQAGSVRRAEMGRAARTHVILEFESRKQLMLAARIITAGGRRRKRLEPSLPPSGRIESLLNVSPTNNRRFC